MIFLKRRSLLVNESDVTTTLEIINEALHESMIFTILGNDLSVGRCGWKKAPMCWYIRFDCTDKMWHKVLSKIAEMKVILLPETTGY